MINEKNPKIFSLFTYILLITFVTNVMIPVALADQSYTVKMGTIRDSTAFNSQRLLVRSSDGALHCVYVRIDDIELTHQIFYANSTDGGVTWTEELVSDNIIMAEQHYPCIAIDSKDNIHVTWHGFGWGVNFTVSNIQYRTRTVNGWQTQEAITDKNVSQYAPIITIDSKDNIHIVWGGFGWGVNSDFTNIQYRMKTANGWQTQEAITDKDDSQRYPSMAIDSKDNVHVVWSVWGWGVNTDDRNIQYRMKTANGWQTQEELTDKNSDQFYPCIAIDSKDNVHMVWNGWGWGINIDFSNIQYRMKTSNGWQTQEELTDKNSDQYAPSIAIDSKDNVHMVWHGWGWGTNPNVGNIQYRMRTVNGWQTQEAITDLPYDQWFPNLIWTMYPDFSSVKTNVPESGYAIIYSGTDENGYKIVYLLSSDLKWVGVKTVPMDDFTVLLLIGLGIVALVIVIGIMIVKRKTKS
jgi:hypothetical protein